MSKRIKDFTFIIFLLLLVITIGCEKDEVITVTDIDGNVYTGVKIGTQIWKEAGNINWQDKNTESTNETGFTALPGGFRYNNGIFYSYGSSCIWWSSTGDPENDGNVCIRILVDNSSSVGRITEGKYNGYSVRCLKN
jgi:hypothetical protein